MCKKKDAKSEFHQMIDGHPIFNMIAQNYLRLEQSIVQELYYGKNCLSKSFRRNSLWNSPFLF